MKEYKTYLDTNLTKTALAFCVIVALQALSPSAVASGINRNCDSSCADKDNSSIPSSGAHIIAESKPFAGLQPIPAPAPNTPFVNVGAPNLGSKTNIRWYSARSMSFLPAEITTKGSPTPTKELFGIARGYDPVANEFKKYATIMWTYDWGVLRTPSTASFNVFYDSAGPSGIYYFLDLVGSGPTAPSGESNSRPSLGWPYPHNKYQLFYGSQDGAALYTEGLGQAKCINLNATKTINGSPGDCLATGFEPTIKDPVGTPIFTHSGPPKPYSKYPLSFNKEVVAKENKGYDVYGDPSTWSGTVSYTPDIVDAPTYGVSPQQYYYALRQYLSTEADGSVNWFLPADDGSVDGKGWYVTCDNEYTPEITGLSFTSYESAKFMCMRNYSTEYYIAW